MIDEREGRILLGLKKRKLGEGKYNGFGGRVEEGETPEQAALREMAEEACIRADAKDLEKVAEIGFVYPHAKDKGWDQLVHVFVLRRWEGSPNETVEMAPEWFSVAAIPYRKMWGEDQHFLPLILEGKRLKAWFSFGEDNEKFEKHRIEVAEKI